MLNANGHFGTHITRTPAGTFAFVGDIPTALADEVDATKGDVLGGRAHRAPDGTLKAWRVPSFPTQEDARAYAASRGVTLTA